MNSTKVKLEKPSLNIDELIENTERKQLEKQDTVTLWTKTTEGLAQAYYAYDFLITIIGTKTEALAIKQKCTAFLNQLNLTLSDEKTLITNPKDRPVSFLGYVIQNAPLLLLFLFDHLVVAAVAAGLTPPPKGTGAPLACSYARLWSPIRLAYAGASPERGG